jgi:hypothetical protein
MRSIAARKRVFSHERTNDDFRNDVSFSRSIDGASCYDFRITSQTHRTRFVMQRFESDTETCSEEQLAHETPDLDLAMDDQKIENRVVSPCGRFESFDCNGYHFEVDWDEIDPPDEAEEPGIPHEVVMREMHELIRELKARDR